MADLDGRRAIVLGGTSGIGLAAARQLAARGAAVTVSGRSAERFAALDDVPDSITFAPVDVQDRDALAALFDGHAGFDYLVCAATGGERALGPFLEMDLDGYRGSFAKLWGYTNAVRLGAPQLAADGAITLVSGFPARRSNPGTVALSSVGCAVEGFMKAVVAELAPRRINVVSPGLIDTPMFPVEGAAREQFLAGGSAHLPVPRAGSADEVAAAILMTLTNGYMSGAVVDVDGGAPFATGGRRG